MSTSSNHCPPRLYPALRALLDWPDDWPLDRAVEQPSASLSRAQPPRVRPAAAVKQVHTTQDAAPVTLGDAARAALLFQPDADTTTFDIALDEQLLGNVRCRISLGKAGIDAIFVVTHATERWLLQSEAPRLRQMLEARGLTVRHVTVVDAADDDAPHLLT